MDNRQEKGNLLRVGGLWKEETKTGDTYLSGSWGGVKILVFKNSHKSEDRHPDYNMFLAEKQRPQQEGGGVSEGGSTTF